MYVKELQAILYSLDKESEIFINNSNAPLHAACAITEAVITKQYQGIEKDAAYEQPTYKSNLVLTFSNNNMKGTK